MKRSAIINSVPCDNRSTMVLDKFQTGDIIALLLNADAKAGENTRSIAHRFRGNTRTESARNIWNFLKNEITYKEDPDGGQWVKSPGQLVHSGFGDCKSFSLFTASILKNLGIDYLYRFAGYDGKNIPTHVYIVCFDEAGGPIIIDAVYTAFNAEKSYTYKQDKMPLYYLSGLPKPRKIGYVSGSLDFKKDDFERPLSLEKFGEAAKEGNVLDIVKAWGKTLFSKETWTQEFSLLFFKNKIEKQLKTGAPFFIYLLAEPLTLPEKARVKREKAYKLWKALKDTTGLKEPAFIAFIKDAIKANTGKTWDNVLPEEWRAYNKYYQEAQQKALKLVTNDKTGYFANKSLVEIARAMYGLKDVDYWLKNGRPALFETGTVTNYTTKSATDTLKLPDGKTLNYNDGAKKVEITLKAPGGGTGGPVIKIGVVPTIIVVAIISAVGSIAAAIISTFSFKNEDVPDPQAGGDWPAAPDMPPAKAGLDLPGGNVNVLGAEVPVLPLVGAAALLLYATFNNN